MEMTKEEYERLYRRLKDDEEEIPPFDEDKEKGVATALDSLSDRECDIVVRAVMRGETLESISEDYNVSRQRVSEIKRRSLRRLRHPRLFGYIQYGESAMNKRRFEQMLFPCPFCGAQATIFEDGDNLCHVQCECGVTAGHNCHGETPEEAKDIWNTRSESFKSLRREYRRFEREELLNTHDVRIDEIGLGVRSVNCLKRESVETLGGLIRRLKRNPDYLKQVRNLGDRSRRDVKEHLEDLGVWDEKYST